MSRRKANTDKPTEYGPAAAEQIAQLLGRRYDTPTLPTALSVTADVEWSGTYNPNPHRTLNADGLAPDKVRAVLAATEAAQEASHRVGASREFSSYRATGWKAQMNKLLDLGAAGSAAADRAGLTVTDRTVLRWLAEEQTPSRANQERIHAAYHELARRDITEAQEAAQTANRAVADALSGMLRERYGAEIRLFNITNVEWGW